MRFVSPQVIELLAELWVMNRVEKTLDPSLIEGSLASFARSCAFDRGAKFTI